MGHRLHPEGKVSLGQGEEEASQDSEVWRHQDFHRRRQSGSSGPGRNAAVQWGPMDLHLPGSRSDCDTHMVLSL